MRARCLFLFFIYLITVNTHAQVASLPVEREVEIATLNPAELIQLVNQFRSAGCQCGDTRFGPAPPVTWNNQLEAASLNHSKVMFRKNKLSHIEPNGSTAGERIKQAGYQWKSYGENIAQGFTSEKEVIQGWMKSPGHCRNIMNRNFTEMGVARAGNYWTLEIATK